MIKSEYEIWLSLGGTLTMLELIDDEHERIKESPHYLDYQKTHNEEECKVLLDKVALYMITQDSIQLMNAVYDVRALLRDGNTKEALEILNSVFVR